MARGGAATAVVRIRAMAPEKAAGMVAGNGQPSAERPPGATRDRWVQDSPIGPVTVEVSDAGVRRIDLGAPRGASDGVAVGDHRTARGAPAPEVAAALDEYFAGDLGALVDLPVDLTGITPFRKAVLLALRTVAPGAVTTYGALAAEVRRPGAARAVGGAVGANPVPIIIPCHRVLAAGGAIGGYSAGLERKMWLLDHEGVARARPVSLRR